MFCWTPVKLWATIWTLHDYVQFVAHDLVKHKLPMVSNAALKWMRPRKTSTSKRWPWTLSLQCSCIAFRMKWTSWWWLQLAERSCTAQRMACCLCDFSIHFWICRHVYSLCVCIIYIYIAVSISDIAYYIKLVIGHSETRFPWNMGSFVLDPFAKAQNELKIESELAKIDSTWRNMPLGIKPCETLNGTGFIGRSFCMFPVFGKQ